MKSNIMNSSVNRVLCTLLMLTLALSTVVFPSRTATAAVEEYIAYEDQLGLLTVLGVYEHITSETMPESTVTRAQFAEVVANLSHYNGAPSGENPYYTDVPSDHEYFSYIQYVTKNFMMNGIGNYLFAPDENISQIQALTVMLKILGYADIAQIQGGYPTGYISLGSKINLVSGSVGTGNDPITVGQLTELIYNTLCSDVVEALPAGDSLDYNTKSGRTLLYDRFSVIVHTGLITASEQTSLYAPEGEGRSYMAVDGVRYRTTYDANSHIGTNAVCFIKEGKPGTVVFIADYEETKVLEIDAENLDGYKDFVYSYTEKEEDETAKLSLNVKIIYNGRYSSLDELESKDLVPEVGGIRLIDLDNDKLYDVLIITNYEYYVINAIGTSDLTIYDKFGHTPIVMDIADDERFVSYNAYGKKIDLDYFRADDCIEVAVSKDGYVVDVSLVTNKYEGSVSGLGNGEATLGSNTYKIHSSLIAPLRDSSGALLREGIAIGLNGRFHISDSGMIVHYEKIAATNEQYGYMIAYAKVGSSLDPGVSFKIMTADTPVIYSPADHVRYVNSNLADAKEYVLEPSEIYQTLVADGVKRDVVRFSTNDAGKITKLELPKDKSGDTSYVGYSDDFFAKDAFFDNARIFRQMIGSKYIPDSNTIVFTVPIDEDAADEYYQINTRSVFGDDTTRDVHVYGSDENYIPSVLVMYTATASSGGSTNSTAVARNAAFLVTSVTRTVFDDGEEGYKISGWMSGGKATVYTEADVVSYNVPEWGYPKVYAKDLKPGDIFQYNTDIHGRLANILPLYRMQDFGKYTEAILTGTKNPHQLTAYDALDISHTMHGEVVRKGSKSITVNARNDLDPEWNRNYLVSTEPHVVIYDSKNEITTNASVGDIQIGDKVFLRDYYHTVREVVIFR